MVQRCDNLVDLDKCCKMSIYLQRLVPIQPRTSPLKFDHLVESFGVKYGIVSFNLDVGPGDEEAALSGSGTEETGGSDDVAHGGGPFFPSTPLEPVPLCEEARDAQKQAFKTK